MTSWCETLSPALNPRARLVCFHHAGGSSAAYIPWAREVPETIELIAIQLPGRGRRQREPPLSHWQPAVEAAYEAIRTCMCDERPLVLFGHSLGALLAYELACRLQWRKIKSFQRLYVSGRGAPHRPSTEAAIHELPDPEFVTRLGAFDGTPDQVLQDRELMEILLPMLRADFAMVDSYTHTARPKLSCPITAFGGTRDEWVSREDLEAWAGLTAASFRSVILEGGHFFVREHASKILALIMGDLGLL